MKNIILFASITIASGLLLTNIYNSLVDVKSWGANIPSSIETAKEYFKTVSPGNFYRVFSPVNQVLAVSVLILFWKYSPSVRLYLGIALVLYVAADVLTFAYFYPRNDILFKNPLTDIAPVRKTLAEWKEINWVRSAIVFAGLIFSFLSLNKIYSLQ